MDDPLKSWPGYLMRRASSALSGELSRRLNAFDLRIVDMTILLMTDANPGITQSELGRALDIQRANMTPMTAKLVERGLITREAMDGRSQGLALTSAGKTLAAQASATAEQFERELIDRVAAELRPHIVPVLSALWLTDQ